MKLLQVLTVILIAAFVLGCGVNPPTPSPAAHTKIAPIQIAPTISAPTRRTISASDIGARIALAAEDVVGMTTIYDPQYVKLGYPNGDVPIERGTCTDVVVRAFRAIAVDLQVRVHEDMQKISACIQETGD
jgi:uncharacterized protein YijF (DUF1287 family)